MLSRLKLLPLLSVAAALSTSPAQARWGLKEEAGVVLESSVEHMLVHADGSIEGDSEATFSIQKESAIERMKLFPIPYDPNTTQLSILAASTTNGGVKQDIPATAIDDKAIDSGHQGLSNFHQILIPLHGLQVGSKFTYKMSIKHKAPFIPGALSMQVHVAREYFTLSDVTEIRSEIPLFVEQRGASDVASIEQSKVQNQYVIKISLLRPMIRLPVGEPNAVITPDTLPRIEISSTKDWSVISQPLSQKITTALQEPLPPELAAIADAAAKAGSESKKANLAMAKLIEQVKYLGDWRSEQGYYVPRTLAEIAKTKQGDCKDFSFATVAMLRKLGINASLALVHRGAEDQVSRLLSGSEKAFDPLLPGLDHFNHAIVTAVLDGKTYWLDPTNPIAHVGSPFSDIADRAALVLDGKATALTHIPKPDGHSAVATTAFYNFRPNGRADALAEVRLTGALIDEIERATSREKEEQKKLALLGLITPGGEPSFVGRVDDIEPDFVPKAGPGEKVEQFVFSIDGKEKKTSLGNSFQVPPPSLIRLLLTPGKGRVTGISLGDVGSMSAKTYLANFVLQGDVPHDCSVKSPWASVSRTFEKKANGLVITDSVHLLKEEISLVEVGSSDFEALQKKLENCVDDTLLVYKWTLPDRGKGKFIPYTNPLISSRERLIERVREIEGHTAQDYYRYTYARTLLFEIIHTNPKALAEAVGRLGAETYAQSFEREGKFEPEGLEESKFYFKRALELDPEEATATIANGNEALQEGRIKGALELADKVLVKSPKSCGANSLKIRIYLRERDVSQAIKDSHIKWVVEKGNELLADPQLPCKSLIRGIMIQYYQLTKNSDEVDKLNLQEVEENPKSAWALLNYAAYLNNTYRYEEAVEYSRRALKVAPVGMARYTLSWALGGLAAEEMSTNPTSQTGLAICEEALENSPQNEGCLRLMAAAYDIFSRSKNDPQLHQQALQMTAAADQSNQAGGLSIPVLRPRPQDKRNPALLSKIIASIKPPEEPGASRAPASVSPAPAAVPGAPAAQAPAPPPPEAPRHPARTIASLGYGVQISSADAPELRFRLDPSGGDAKPTQDKAQDISQSDPQYAVPSSDQTKLKAIQSTLQVFQDMGCKAQDGEAAATSINDQEWKAYPFPGYDPHSYFVEAKVGNRMQVIGISVLQPPATMATFYGGCTRSITHSDLNETVGAFAYSVKASKPTKDVPHPVNAVFLYSKDKSQQPAPQRFTLEAPIHDLRITEDGSVQILTSEEAGPSSSYQYWLKKLTGPKGKWIQVKLRTYDANGSFAHEQILARDRFIPLAADGTAEPNAHFVEFSK